MVKRSVRKFKRHVNHDKRMNPIEVGGHMSKVKVTMDDYINDMVGMIEIKRKSII